MIKKIMYKFVQNGSMSRTHSYITFFLSYLLKQTMMMQSFSLSLTRRHHSLSLSITFCCCLSDCHSLRIQCKFRTIKFKCILRERKKQNNKLQWRNVYVSTVTHCLKLSISKVSLAVCFLSLINMSMELFKYYYYICSEQKKSKTQNIKSLSKWTPK